MHINTIFARSLSLIFIVIFALAIFILIVWRGGATYGITFNYKTIFFIALGLILLLIFGFFLSMSSAAPIEIVGLLIIGAIYLLWFISPLLIVRDIVSIVNKIPSFVMIIVSLLRLGVGFYYGTLHIRITPLTIVSDRVTQEHTIVFVSDLHVEAIHNRHYVQTIVDRIKTINPDFVIIGGDLMNTGKPVYVDALLPFNELSMPIYATLGNHDHMGNTTAIFGVTKTTKIILLRDQSISVDGLQLVGIDDKSYRGTTPLPMILQKSKILDTKQFTILVSHQPQNLNKLVGYPIDLELAGHTHNGQFFPLYLIIRLFNDYAYGEYHLNDMTAFVSQGIGSWGAPFRLGTQRELVLITLKPSTTGR